MKNIRYPETKTETDKQLDFVDVWYDRHTRSWVIQRKDRHGDQIGEADYVYTKWEAKLLKKQYEKEATK